MTYSQTQPDSIAESSLLVGKDLPPSMSPEESENKRRIIDGIQKFGMTNQLFDHLANVQKPRVFARVDNLMQETQANGPYSNMENEKLGWLVDETLEGFVEEINGNKFYVGLWIIMM